MRQVRARIQGHTLIDLLPQDGAPCRTNLGTPSPLCPVQRSPYEYAELRAIVNSRYVAFRKVTTCAPRIGRGTICANIVSQSWERFGGRIERHLQNQPL